VRSAIDSKKHAQTGGIETKEEKETTTKRNKRQVFNRQIKKIQQKKKIQNPNKEGNLSSRHQRKPKAVVCCLVLLIF
jgi:hypothetical protein